MWGRGRGGAAQAGDELAAGWTGQGLQRGEPSVDKASGGGGGGWARGQDGSEMGSRTVLRTSAVTFTRKQHTTGT